MDEKEKLINEGEEVSAAAEEIASSGEEPASSARHFKEDERLKKKNTKKLEKQIRKQHRLEKHADRPVAESRNTPEEDGEEDAPAAPKLKFPSKRIAASAIIILLLFLIVFFAFNTDRFSFHNISNFIKYGIFNSNSDESFPLDIKGESVSAGDFLRVGQDICYTSDTRTQLLNNYGRSVFSVQHAFINPVLTVGKKGALVYNLGGSGFQLIDKEGKEYTDEAKDKILTADYADNGYYAIVTQSGGYLSKLYIYNDEHEQIFAYSFANYYVTSVSVNSKGSRAVVSGVSALNGVNIAALYVLDFTKETPLYFSEMENNIIYKVKYLNDKYVCAVGRSASCVMNTSNGDIVTKDYEGCDLTAYDINTDTGTYTLSLSGSGDGRNCNIVSFTNTGAEDRSFTVDDKVIDISTYKGRVALLTADKVSLYSKDGKKYSDKELTSDPHSVVLYTKSDAYVLCTGYINTVSL